MFRFRSSSFGYGGGVSTKDKTDDLEALLEMEKSFWKSAGDQGFYRKNMAPEGKVIMSMGVLDKEGVVASMSDAEPQESFDIHNPALVEVSDGVAALTYSAIGRRKADSDAYRATS
jgi:hypothetical protein